VPSDSILYLRMILQGFFRMPPLASDVVDASGTEVVRAWIASIPSCL